MMNYVGEVSTRAVAFSRMNSEMEERVSQWCTVGRIRFTYYSKTARGGRDDYSCIANTRTEIKTLDKAIINLQQLQGQCVQLRQ